MSWTHDCDRAPFLTPSRSYSSENLRAPLRIAIAPFDQTTDLRADRASMSPQLADCAIGGGFQLDGLGSRKRSTRLSMLGRLIELPAHGAGQLLGAGKKTTAERIMGRTIYLPDDLF